MDFIKIQKRCESLSQTTIQMIIFFRNIRKKNLTENKLSNQLIYSLTIVITFFYYTSVLSQTNTVQDTLSDNQLYTHNQKQYVKATRMPFTGVRLKRYPNGKKWFQYHYVNGEGHGLFTTWRGNGLKEMEWTEVNTGEIKIGIETWWNRFGVKTAETDHDTGIRTRWRELYGITYIEQELVNNSKIKYRRQKSLYADKSLRTIHYKNKFGFKDSISNYWYPDGTKGEEIIYKDTQEQSWTVWDHKGRKFRPYLDFPLDTVSRSDDVLHEQKDGLFYLKDSDKPYTGLFRTNGLLMNSKDRPMEWRFNLIGFRGQDYKTEVLMIFGKPHGLHKQFESDGDLIDESFIEQDRWDDSYSSSIRYRELQSQRASRPFTVNKKVVIFFLLLIGIFVILLIKKRKDGLKSSGRIEWDKDGIEIVK